MRISLLRISLLRFFKIFHKNLPYANFGLLFSLVRFLGQKVYFANANFGLFFSLVWFFGLKVHFANAILSFFYFLLRLQENWPIFALAN